MANPLDLARAAGSDVALILAEQRLTALRRAESPDGDEIRQICRTISRTAPASLLGAGVKLRLLLDPELGLGVLETSADTMLSLRQIAELVKRLGL